jgi:hypothetical protein
VSEQCRAVSVCRGSVGAVSVDIRLTLVSRCRAVSEQTAVSEASSVGQCRGFLTVDLLGQRRAVSECRSVGVSECRSVGLSECRSVEQCRSVGVSECRSVGWVSGGCRVKQ